MVREELDCAFVTFRRTVAHRLGRMKLNMISGKLVNILFISQTTVHDIFHPNRRELFYWNHFYFWFSLARRCPFNFW